ncbi:MAG: hypothetical protein JSV01_09305, partial [Desulfobacterales bacterium]
LLAKMVKIDSLKDFETSSRQTSARKGSLTLSQRPWLKRLKNDVYSQQGDLLPKKVGVYCLGAFPGVFFSALLNLSTVTKYQNVLKYAT